MKKHKQKHNTVKVLLVLFLVVIIGSCSWLLYNRQHKNSKIPVDPPITNVTATDSSKSFSYIYPSNWSIQPYHPTGEDTPDPMPDWSKTPQPITLKERHSIDDADITIQGDNTGSVTIDSVYNERTIDQFNTYSKTKVNGNDALFHVTTFSGPSQAEHYKDYDYLIVKDKKSVRLAFREYYSNTTLDGEHDFNASKLTPQFIAIVRSVTFL